MMRKSERPIFVDTSVLIDGRIISVASSGFISDTLMIPRSVIGELQYLADTADSEKRARARHGLDVVTKLQELAEVKVKIFPDGSHAKEGVDERLLKLSKQYNGALCTIDYNLNKVAQVEGITVLNVNELAKSLRMTYLPGEMVSLMLTTKGNDGTQGVGHLEDGTMVVVEQAKSKIGTVVEAEIIRSLQTAAGRMMFARLNDKTSVTTARKAQPKQDAPKKVESKKVSESKQQNNASQKATGRRQRPQEAAAQKPKKTARRQSNEDRLIDLVNNQE
jgi:uncharacterized protein YacL